jgi:hypothetical protein
MENVFYIDENSVASDRDSQHVQRRLHTPEKKKPPEGGL